MQFNSTQICCKLERLLKKIRWLFTFFTGLTNPCSLSSRPKLNTKSLVTWLALYLTVLNSGMPLVNVELELKIQTSVCFYQSRQVTATHFQSCLQQGIALFFIVRSSHRTSHFSVKERYTKIM